MKTTSTAQYAAVAAKTSCLLALVKTEIAVAKIRANMRVIEAINVADTLHLRNMYIGISINAVDATATMTLINVPRRSAE